MDFRLRYTDLAGRPASVAASAMDKCVLVDADLARILDGFKGAVAYFWRNDVIKGRPAGWSYDPQIPRREIGPEVYRAHKPVDLAAAVVGCEVLYQVDDPHGRCYVRARVVADARTVLLSDGRAMSATTPATALLAGKSLPNGACEFSAGGALWRRSRDRLELVDAHAAQPVQPLGALVGAQGQILVETKPGRWQPVTL